MNETRSQFLISRAIDGEITDREWTELQSLAENSPRLWREFALCHRDHVGLAGAVDSAAAAAEQVPLPALSGAHYAAPLRGRMTRWSGWAVAALVALVALPQLNSSLKPQSPSEQSQANLASIDTVADALQAYLTKGHETGQVIGQMPQMVLLETRPATSGDGYELVYLRQVLERTIVPNLYEVSGQDDLGQPTLARYEHRSANEL